MHSYRYRWGYETPDPGYEDAEGFMADLPAISVPTVLIQGAEDGASRPESSEGKERHFTGGYQRILVERRGPLRPEGEAGNLRRRHTGSHDRQDGWMSPCPTSAT